MRTSFAPTISPYDGRMAANVNWNDHIRRAYGSEIHRRLVELDRTEEISTTFRCIWDAQERSIRIEETHHHSPKLRPDWDEGGIRRREAWCGGRLKQGVCGSSQKKKSG